MDSVEDVIVEVVTDTGESGYGEAPPTGVITGDTRGAITGAIQDHIAKSIIGMDVDDLEDVLQTIQKCMIHNSSAKAAVDMAVYDLYGKLYRIPVYKLLGGARKKIVTDITISVNPPEQMAYISPPFIYILPLASRPSLFLPCAYTYPPVIVISLFELIASS